MKILKRSLKSLVIIGWSFYLTACQMPSPTGTPPSSGSSGSAGSPSGSGGSSGPSGSSGSNTSTSTGTVGGSVGGGVSLPGGVSIPGGISLPSGSGKGGSSGDGDSLEDLDDALDGSLEEFDDAIANNGKDQGPETIDILTRSGNPAGQSEGPLFEEGDVTEADGSIENSDVEQRADAGAPPSTDNSENTQTASNSSSGQSGTPGEVIPVPEDIDDGRGDSIVLRQIRDAAMKEKDPILREKLWDEYRRIKNQQ